MAMVNRGIMAQARVRLKGKWGTAASVGVVDLVLLATASAIPYGVGALLVTGPLLVGLYSFHLRLVSGQEARVGHLFDWFQSFVSALVAHILTSVFILLWMLLLIVPGILAALSYSMTFLILAENRQLDGLEAIRRSKKMMEGHRWRFVCLAGRFTGWFLLGVATIGIGFLWIGPYFVASTALFYQEVRGPVSLSDTPQQVVIP